VKNMTTKTVLGIFSDRESAEDAIDELEENGYTAKDISVIMKEGGDPIVRGGETMGNKVAEGTVTGITTGAAIGGLAGLLVGIGAIAIPGVGAFLIGGPIAAALGLTGAAASTVTGAATGGLAGGLLGALTGLGLPEESARVYEKRVREGAILLAVPVDKRIEYQDVRKIFEDNDADQIETVSS
jgi:hypothetical protein